MTNPEFLAELSKIKRGDPDGLKTIYQEYSGAVSAIFLAMTRRPADAEDLTSELFLRLWEKADTYHGLRSHKGWLFTMARNLGIDFLRRAKHETPVDVLSGEDLYPEQTDSFERLLFEESLSGLDEMSKRIIILKLLGGFTFREISKILKKPQGTVSWIYRQALLSLKNPDGNK